MRGPNGSFVGSALAIALGTATLGAAVADGTRGALVVTASPPDGVDCDGAAVGAGVGAGAFVGAVPTVTLVDVGVAGGTFGELAVVELPAGTATVSPPELASTVPPTATTVVPLSLTVTSDPEPARMTDAIAALLTS